MIFFTAAIAASLVGIAVAHPGSPHPDAQGRYTLEAEGIKAQFIPYGATLTNLWVKGTSHTL
jgi:aldose 1-epimerase